MVLESGNQENFVGEIWNPGLWNTKYSSRNPESGYWNPAPGESVPYKAEALITDSSTYGRHHKTPFFLTLIQTLYFLHSRKWPAPITDTFFASRGCTLYMRTSTGIFLACVTNAKKGRDGNIPFSSFPSPFDVPQAGYIFVAPSSKLWLAWTESFVYQI